MSLTDGIAPPLVAGGILVVVVLAAHLVRVNRAHLSFHLLGIAWVFCLVAVDLIHVGSDLGFDSAWTSRLAFLAAAGAFVVVQTALIRREFGAWREFVLDSWIISACAVLLGWTGAYVAVDHASLPSLVDTVHVSVTAWLAVCLLRQVDVSDLTYLGAVGARAAVGARVGAAALLVAAHVASEPSLRTAALWVLAASYLGLLPMVATRASDGPVRHRLSDSWWSANLPYTVTLASAPVILVAVGADEDARSPLYLVLIGTLAAGLCLRVIVLVSVNQALIDRLTERGEQLRHIAIHDPLTGLVNRQHFLARLSEVATGRDGDAETDGQVLFVDLDGMKRVDDTAGHAAGDAVLREVANRLRRTAPDGAMVARLGGDEFGIVLDGATSRDADRVAADVVDAVAGVYPTEHGSFVINATIGIAAASESDGADEMLRHAGLALNAAKRARRAWDRYVAAMHDHAVRRADDDQTYARVLDERRLELHYQPIVDMEHDQIVGCEVLLRWRTTDGELRDPAGLLEFAERSGQLSTLLWRVLRGALDQVRSWREGGGDLPISVGLATVELLRPDFVATLREELARRDLPAEALTLEVAEEAFVEDPDRVVEVLRELRGVGVGITLVDFGARSSSLAYLSKLPITAIKLDRHFTAALVSYSPTGVVIAGVIVMAQRLELDLVADGIESADQAERLRRLGCRLGQGDHLQQPVTPDAMRDLVAAAAPAVG